VAGLVFFPLLLQGAWELLLTLLRRPWRPSPRVLLLAVLATGLVFALIQLWPPASEAYRHGLALLQWPFRALWALASSGPLPSVSTVYLYPDPTDCLALPALGLAIWAGLRRARRSGPEARRALERQRPK
jgi:hypothetical protein